MWHIDSSDNSVMCLEIRSSDWGFTAADLCGRIWSLRDTYGSVRVVKISCQICNESDCPDQDLEAVGNALNHLQSFDELQLVVAGGWTDAKLSVLLRHVPKKLIRLLQISGVRGGLFLPVSEKKSRIPSIISELQKGEWLSYYREFNFWKVDFDERDCVSLGEFLQSRQQETEPWIHFTGCTFPSFQGYLIVADALIDFGPYSVNFEGNTVKDKTIPSSVTSLTHEEFYNQFEREWKHYGDTFNSVAAEHLAKYSNDNEAGKGDEAAREQWLDLLGTDLVRNSVDYLFLLLLSKPGFIHS